MVRGAILLMVLAGASPAAAQAAPDPRIAELIAAERRLFLPPPPRDPHCDRHEGEIVVCGQATQTERYRVPSTLDEQPLSDRALNTGMPHVGQSLVTDLPDCSPGHGCISGGWAPAPIYYIDLSKLPEPAPGSDADRIAKGEMREP